MKRWVNIMSALIFGAVLLSMTPGFGEAAPAPAGGPRHESTMEHGHAHHHRRSPVRDVRHRNDHRGGHHYNNHHNNRHEHRNPHVRDIHHRPHHDVRHDSRHHRRHAESGGNVTITLAQDI